MNPSILPDDSDFRLTTFEESQKLSDHSHAVHCCIYSHSKTRIFDGYVSTALISMQMRFDGQLGFPGGCVDKRQTVLEALRRELVEEVNLNSKLFPTEKNYLFSHIHVPKKWCFHFYAKEVSLEEFEAMERNALDAEDYGKENLGLVRVPMFTLIDGYRGFPMFLKNCFAGNARDQLLNFLVHSKLMSSEDIQVALQKSQKVS